MILIRSAGPMVRLTGPSVTSPRLTTAPVSETAMSPARAGLADRQLQVPRLADLVRGVAVQPGEGPVDPRRLAAGSLRARDPEGADVLVRIGLIARVGRPLRAGAGPLALLAGSLGQLVPLALVRRVRVGRPPPGELALGDVGIPAAGEHRAVPGELVQLQDLARDRGEQGAVVADQGQPGPAAAQVRLEQGQSGVVEVVGRLVEQQDVRLGQQYRGQAEPRLLAARQLGCVPVQEVVRQGQARR